MTLRLAALPASTPVPAPLGAGRPHATCVFCGAAGIEHNGHVVLFDLPVGSELRVRGPLCAGCYARLDTTSPSASAASAAGESGR